jgi:catechol 2,3-dioxygenase-like lactoylglutathione lyase family enzyme
MTEKPNVLQIYHININCSDFDRSLAFYELIGFRRVVDFSQKDGKPLPSLGEAGLGPILGLPSNCAARAELLTLGDDPRATRLDLIEWTTPRSPPATPRNLSHLGMARLCLKVRDCQPLYEALTAHGYKVYSPPTLIELAGVREYVFCCEDPDGTVIEFMQFQRA